MPTITITSNALEQLRVVGQMFDADRIRTNERERVTHERFNIFTTLLKDDDEVRLHTRFIYCLLNPDGCHGLGNRFLRLFFDTLAEHPGKNHENETAQCDIPRSENWMVENEAYREKFGRIDILLEQRKFGVAIENKIYHGEEKEQLARYASYLEKQHGDGLVIFLTLYGIPSVTHKGRIPYIRISYADQILAWLDKCLRETYNIIPVNQVLLQYRQVVRKLTGKTTESATMKEITDYIAQHTDLIRYREQIKDALDEARASSLELLAKEIIQNLKPTYGTSFLYNNPPFGVDPEGTLVIQPPATSALKEAPFKIYIQHWAEKKILLIGIETTEELAQTHQRLFTEMNDKLSAQGYNPDRVFKTWPIGWHNLIDPFDDAVIATIGKTSFTDTASKLITDIQSYIEALERAYKDVCSIIPLSESTVLP